MKRILICEDEDTIREFVVSFTFSGGSLMLIDSHIMYLSTRWLIFSTSEAARWLP